MGFRGPLHRAGELPERKRGALHFSVTPSLHYSTTPSLRSPTPFRGQPARRSLPEFQTTGRSREDDFAAAAAAAFTLHHER